MFHIVREHTFCSQNNTELCNSEKNTSTVKERLKQHPTEYITLNSSSDVVNSLDTYNWEAERKKNY